MAAYLACIATTEYTDWLSCTQCVDCPACDDLAGVSYRLIGGDDGGSAFCTWQTLCNESLCNIDEIKFTLEWDSPDNVATIMLRSSSTDVVSWEKTICSSCQPTVPTPSFDCWTWLGESSGWSFTEHDADLNRCDWSIAVPTVKPASYSIPCLARPNYCPYCKDAENGIPQYMEVTIQDHWTCDCDPVDCECNAVGTFLLEFRADGAIENDQCEWHYEINPLGTHSTNECAFDWITAGFVEDSGDVYILVRLVQSSHIVIWRSVLPWLYPSGADAVDCMLDMPVSYCTQSGLAGGDEQCRWNNDTVNITTDPNCRPAAGPSIHIKAVT